MLCIANTSRNEFKFNFLKRFKSENPIQISQKQVKFGISNTPTRRSKNPEILKTVSQDYS